MVAPEAVRDRAGELAGKLAASSPSAIRMGLRAFYATQDMELRPALELLEGELGTLLTTDDAREGLQAFFEKREPKFTGS